MYAKAFKQVDFKAGMWPNKYTAKPAQILTQLAPDEICFLGCDALDHCAGNWQAINADGELLCPYPNTNAASESAKMGLKFRLITMAEAEELLKVPVHKN